jgi:hypothetical protein
VLLAGSRIRSLDADLCVLDPEWNHDDEQARDSIRTDHRFFHSENSQLAQSDQSGNGQADGILEFASEEGLSDEGTTAGKAQEKIAAVGNVGVEFDY